MTQQTLASPVGINGNDDERVRAWLDRLSDPLGKDHHAATEAALEAVTNTGSARDQGRQAALSTLQEAHHHTPVFGILLAWHRQRPSHEPARAGFEEVRRAVLRSLASSL